MRLERIDQVTAPGSPDRPNEDAWRAAEGFAAVIDGATGLGGHLLPGLSDAAWLAEAAAEALSRNALSASGREVLRAAAAELEARFLAERSHAPAEVYELPMASMMTVQSTGPARLTALWFGDCAAVVQRPGEAVELVGDVVASRSHEAEGAARLAALLHHGPAGSLRAPEVLASLRVGRNRYNQGDGPWVLAPDRRCADHARSAELSAPPDTWLLLASDGFTALAADYGRYDLPGLLAAARERGLAALLAETRAIEQGDPQGVRFPRYKVSDDATALLLRVV